MSPFLFIIELFTRVLKIEKKAISITNEDERRARMEMPR
jgi:hypothetical protein